jgi:hypothetical protein
MEFVLSILIFMPGFGNQWLHLPTKDCAAKLEEIRPILKGAPVTPRAVLCLRSA